MTDKDTNAVTADILGYWDKIVTGDKGSLVSFLSLLGDTPEDLQIIHKITDSFQSAEISDDRLNLVFTTEDSDGNKDTATVFVNKPYEGDTTGIPEAALLASRVANGIYTESYGGGDIGFTGVHDENFIGAGNWDPGAYDDDEIEGLSPAMDYGQNLICFDNKQQNNLGEDALVFFSHEASEPELMENALDLSYSQVVLRLLFQHMTEEVVFEEIYS